MRDGVSDCGEDTYYTSPPKMPPTPPPPFGGFWRTQEMLKSWGGGVAAGQEVVDKMFEKLEVAFKKKKEKPVE